MYTQRVNYGMKETYVGLSTDTKPSSAGNGDVLLEMDTGKRFLFSTSDAKWYEQPSSDGGSSGSSGGGAVVFPVVIEPDLSADPENSEIGGTASVTSVEIIERMNFVRS